MSEDAKPSIPRIRRAPLPNDAHIVVRGMSDDEPAVSIRQAHQFRRRFPAWDRYGISGFIARSDDEVDDLGAHHLDRFEILLVFDLSDLLVAGFEVVATFRSPHVTIAFAELPAVAVERLLALRHRKKRNPAFRKEGP